MRGITSLSSLDSVVLSASLDLEVSRVPGFVEEYSLCVYVFG